MKWCDGTEYNFKIPEKIIKKNSANASGPHIRARTLLQRIFPHVKIIEEVPIQIDEKRTLKLDFFIPTLLLAIEVHGQQHYKFNSFHFKNKGNFLKAQQNDEFKKEWCNINQIRLVVLAYNESDEEWLKLIQN